VHTQPSDLLPMAGLPNFRNVGGLATADGRLVRTGLLYRSGALDKLEGVAAARFARLGIRTIYDLRSEAERQVRPDLVPAHVEYVALNMIGDVARHTPGRIMASLNDPVAAHETFGEGRGVAMFLTHYREFVSLPSARLALGRFFGELVNDRRRPALVHCMGGKDRTGWTVACLLLLLDVPADDVMADFVASNDHLARTLDGFLTDFEARGGDPALIFDFMRTRPEYLEAALDEMRSSFGTIEHYFSDGLGLDRTTIAALRADFVDRRRGGPEMPRGRTE
jgi:protein-tyrosine phosphatase